MSLGFIESEMPGVIRCSLNPKILRMRRMFILDWMKCTRIKDRGHQPRMGMLDTSSQFIGV